MEGLGRNFALLEVTYKPYPSGVVINSTIDACLEIEPRLGTAANVAKIVVKANPATFALGGHRRPRTPLEANVSLYHWIAATLTSGRAGLAEIEQHCIDDPVVTELRDRVEPVPDSSLGQNESIVEITLMDGAVLRSHVAIPRGSITKPMTDVELDAKFLEQANLVLLPEKSEALLGVCRNAVSLKNVGRAVSQIIKI